MYFVFLGGMHCSVALHRLRMQCISDTLGIDFVELQETVADIVFAN